MSSSLSDQIKASAITVALGFTTLGLLNMLSYAIRKRPLSILSRTVVIDRTAADQEIAEQKAKRAKANRKGGNTSSRRSFSGRDFDANSFNDSASAAGRKQRTPSMSSFPSFLSPGFAARHAGTIGEGMEALSLGDGEDIPEEDEDEENEERQMDSYPKNIPTKLQVKPDDLLISEARLDDATINLHLSHLLEHLKQRTAYHLGYPYNLQFKSDGLVPFLQFSINNLGDPFKASNYGVHSREFEVAVLEFFASMWDIKKGDYWGYITTCGTEGNLLGVLYGREKFSPKRNAYLYCSKETHYSVPKAATMYQMPLELIGTQASGELDYADLEAKLLKHMDVPAVISLNAGTTVKGAYDTIDTVLEILNRIGKKREDFYIHVDGALNGMILPFISSDCENKRISFDKAIDSVSVSGHKMLGCPMPCGVVVTRIEHMQRWGKDVEYLNSTDTTIMGSRNGQAALAMWVALQRKGLDGMRADVVQCLDNAKYLKELFEKDNVKTMLNDYSTTVVFERPPEDVVQKWQLACTGDIAHVVVMPSVSKSKLRRFHREVMAARARDASMKVKIKPQDDSTYRMVAQ